MKKLWAILFVTITMVACQSRNESNNVVTKDSVIDNHDNHPKKTQGLTLHNGIKWKADSSTVLNVDLMQKIVSGAKKGSLENYNETASGLENALNKMVSECKMKGADHDALHQWLEPLMSKTNELKKVNDIETADAMLPDIEKQINLFPQYFER